MAYCREKEIEVQDKVSDHYENVRYSRWYSKAYQHWWTAKMLSMIKNDNLRGRILDNGCGIGSHFEELSRYSKDIIGFDLSAQMLCKAKANMEQVVLGDSQILPFKNKRFNLVFSRSLLHHLPDPAFSVSEIARVLTDGGEALFSDTNSSILSNLPRKIAKKEKDGHFSESHRNFNDKDLLRTINSHLKIDKIYYFGYVAYPILGFPDLIDIFSVVPFKNYFVDFLIKFDELVSALPVLRKQSWGIIIKASKRKEK